MPVHSRIPGVRKPLTAVADAGLIVAAGYGAFWLRFDGSIPGVHVATLLDTLPWVLLVRMTAFLLFGLFEGLWQYTSVWDLQRLLAATLTSSVMLWGCDWVLGWGLPRSIHPLSAVLLVALASGARIGSRLWREMRPGDTTARRRVLVFGAGDAGEMIVRDMKSNGVYEAVPIGFIDDDRQKVGRRIHGVPVLGTRERLAEIIDHHQPREVLIAMPSAPVQTLREVIRALEPFKVGITTLPSLHEIVNGCVRTTQIRNVRIEDLLARAPVDLDPGPLHHLITGRRVLVTGAGGSIGSELCRQIAGFEPQCLVLLERYENSLFAVHHAINDLGYTFDLHPVIADVTDRPRLEAVFERHRPEVVFHAAAHKHVPLMEFNPCEAVKNNVGGSRLVAETCDRFGVERFILISTDKAVNPTSVMGVTKRVAELAVREIAATSTTQFTTVRFGNVLGSNGSVVPRFLQQIQAGGPVTVTHPDVRRYFMLIPEAVQLVLHAAAMDAWSNCVYVLDMGDQVRLVDMARNLIRLSGYVPEDDIEISFVGLRPGEKLYEELVGDDESAEPSAVSKIIQVRPTVPHALDGRLLPAVTDLVDSAREGDTDRVMQQMAVLVPNFTPVALGVAA